MVPEATLARLNALINVRELKNCDESFVEQPLRQALMTRDGRLAYPIRDGIPILLEEHGILLAQVSDA
jgi:uncharacterized protein YbaR (Trm112 family)